MIVLPSCLPCRRTGLPNFVVPLFFPETVDIAILPDRGCIINTAELGFRGLPRFQELAFRHAVGGDDLYPLDIMLFFHRVGHFPDLCLDSIADLADAGNMLLLR